MTQGDELCWRDSIPYVTHEMGRGEALVGTLRMTGLVDTAKKNIT
jgi:hypothetical protein